jgi:hypothetical protein
MERRRQRTQSARRRPVWRQAAAWLPSCPRPSGGGQNCVAVSGIGRRARMSSASVFAVRSPLGRPDYSAVHLSLFATANNAASIMTAPMTTTTIMSAASQVAPVGAAASHFRHQANCRPHSIIAGVSKSTRWRWPDLTGGRRRH